jgi:hypothetical protein
MCRGIVVFVPFQFNGNLLLIYEDPVPDIFQCVFVDRPVGFAIL